VKISEISSLNLFLVISLIKRASLIPKDKILPILSETDELIKIIAKSVVTSKMKK